MKSKKMHTLRKMVMSCVVTVLVLLTACLTTASAAPGDISTVAGGYIGDGGSATAARINNPAHLVVSADGTKVYIVDTYHQRIRMVSAGTITTVAGNGISAFTGDGGLATSASINEANGVAVDAAGNIYIADSFNQRIRKVDASTKFMSTIAGSGSVGVGSHSGDGGPATSAELFYPYSVTTNTAGTTIYIADSNNHRIRRIIDGTIDTLVGSSTPTFGGDGDFRWNASLNYPTDVAFDAARNFIYIADTNNHRIRKIDLSTDIITTVAGNGTAGYGSDGVDATTTSLNSPYGVAVDAAGDIYIADTYNNRIRKVDHLTGLISTVAGFGDYGYTGDFGPAIFATMSFPSGVAVDSAGNIYIADQNNDCIRKVDTSGDISTFAGGLLRVFYGDGGPGSAASLNYPHAVGTDASGNVYIGDTKNARIRKIDTSGNITTVAGNGTEGSAGDGGPATAANLSTMYGVTADAAGNIYIADSYNHLIRRVDFASGNIDTVAGNGAPGYGSDGGPATATSLNYPRGIAVDAAGNIYIADTDNHRVRKVTYPAGTISTIAGTGTAVFSGDGGLATLGGLNNPTAVAVDAAGNVYIADSFNNRIRKVTSGPTGTITTVAGSGAYGYSGEGAATSASLASPYGVAVNAAGTIIYIADFSNSKVRKVVSGTISTVAGNGPIDVTLGFGGDGGPAGSSILFNPYNVAVDPAGNVYIADVNNWRIRKIATSLPPSLSSVHIASNNANTTRAKVGDIVTLTITASQPITAPTVTIAGHAATVTGSGTSWSASTVMTGTDAQGVVSFSITYKDLSGVAGTAVNSTTDASSVTFDGIAPTVTISTTASNTTRTSPIPVTVTFSETVTGFVSGDVTIGNGFISSFSGSGTTYSISVTPLAQGAVTVDVAAGVALDGAANGNTVAARLSRTYDNLTPFVTITTTASNPTRTSPIPVTVTFSETVTGFLSSDVTIGNGSISLFTAVSGTTYTINVTPTLNGAVTVDVAGGVAQDAAGNGNAAATQLSRTYDNVAPTMVISAPSSTLTRTGPVTYTVTYSGADAVTLANANVTLNTSGTATGSVVSSGTGTASRTVTISGITGDGTLGISIAAATASDLAGNTTAAAGPSATVTVDNTAPTPAISAPSASAVKSGATVTYTVTYTGVDSVTLANTNITLNATGTAGGTAVVSGSGTASRLVTISGITGEGTLGISIAAGTASDLAGNTALAAGPSATFSVDNTAPTLVVSAPSSTITNTGPVTYTVTYTGADSVTLANANITLNATGTAGGTAVVSGSGTASRTVTISGITGEGTLGISIAAGTASDLAGNTALAAGPSATFSVDNTAPTLVVSAPSSTITNTGPVTYTVTYTGADSVTLANANITLNATGTAGGTAVVSGAGTASRLVTISGITGNGTLGISIAAGSASDLAGNTTAAAGPSATFVVDNTAPTMAISAPSSAVTTGGPVTYTVTYTGADSVTLANAILNATGTATGSVVVSGAGTSSRTVTISSITGNGTLGISIAAGTASDQAGNTAAAAGPSATFVVDNTLPTVTITSTAPDPTNAPIPVTVTFSEAVTGFISTDVVVPIGSTVGAFSGSGTTYTFSVTPSGNGLVTIDVAANVAQDTAGNGNTAALQLGRTFDSQNPTVTITSAAPNSTNVSPIPVTVTFSKPVTGFMSTDVGVTNGAITGGSFTGSGTTYNFNVTPTPNTVVTVNVAAGVAQDSASNPNLAAVPLTRTYDIVAPTVTLSSTATNTTNVSPIPVTVIFSETVTGFTSGDVIIGNGNIVLFTAVSGTTYTFTVAPTAEATVTVNVAAGVAQDAAGNNNIAATPLSRTYDSTQPTVTISSIASNQTKTSPIPVTVTFSEAVTGFVVGSVNVTNGTTASFLGSGSIYNFNVIPSANGPVTVNVAGNVAFDAAGNGNGAALQLSRTYDTVAPTLAIGPPSLSVANKGVSVTYTVTYTGADNVTLANANVTLNTSGTATGTVAVSGAGNASRTVTISNITGFDGILGITVGANTASDLGGNLAAPTGPSATFTVDNGSGDLNGDGVVNGADAVKALQIASGLVTPSTIDTAHGDVAPVKNGGRSTDGRIDLADVVALLKKIVGSLTW